MAATDFRDYYAVLGVSRSAAADEIKKAFRKLARQFHPDLNPGDKVAEARFKEVNEAYEVLSDPAMRKKYDQFGQYWKQAGQAGPAGWPSGGFGGGAGGEYEFDRFNSFEEFINELLGRSGGGGYRPGGAPGGFGGGGFGGGGFGGPQTNAGNSASLDQESPLSLSLTEAFRGTKKALRVNGEAIDVNIPAGVKTGSKVRLKGKGLTNGYGQRGDLYLKIELQPHEFFQLDGDNLVCDLPISPDEAALGAKVEVPTPEGLVTVNVPAGVRSGQSLRLRGKGWPAKSGRGDQLVKIMLTVPKTLSEIERSLYEQLRDNRSADPRQHLNNLSL